MTLPKPMRGDQPRTHARGPQPEDYRNLAPLRTKTWLRQQGERGGTPAQREPRHTGQALGIVVRVGKTRVAVPYASTKEERERLAWDMKQLCFQRGIIATLK